MNTGMKAHTRRNIRMRTEYFTHTLLFVLWDERRYVHHLLLCRTAGRGGISLPVNGLGPPF